MKKISLSLVILFSFLILGANSVFAASVWNKIDMKVTINEDGSADVIKTLEVNASDGTEWYYDFLENQITYSDFSVSQDGVPLTKVEPWNVNAGLNEKAGKWGINPVKSNEYELCWGKGSYGKHTAEIRYKINGVVKTYKDGKIGLNHEFYTHSFPTALFSMTISLADGQRLSFVDDSGTTEKLEQNDRVWVFGTNSIEYEFTEDGTVNLDGKLSNGQRVILMLQINSEHGVKGVDSSKTWDEVKKTALKGSSYGSDTYKVGLSFFLVLRLIILIIGIILSIVCVKNRDRGPKLLIGVAFITCSIFGLIGPIISACLYYPTTSFISIGEFKDWAKENASGFNRELPEDLNSSYALLNKIESFSRSKVNMPANIIGAYILRMILDGNIRNIKSEQKVLFGLAGSKEVDAIQFISSPTDDSLKSELYNILKASAGNNGILEPKEIDKYASTESGSRQFKYWMQGAERKGIDFLLTHKDITSITMNDLKCFTDSGKIKLKNMIELRRFFEEFTIMDEREISEIHYWDKLFVYAVLCNQGKTVLESLKIKVPNLSSKQLGNVNYDTLRVADSISTSFSSAISNGMKTAERREAAARSSSGGGGRSSSGGGGGSSGGGGGGGSR